VLAFSFRADCQHHVDELRTTLAELGVHDPIDVETACEGLPDVNAEIRTYAPLLLIECLMSEVQGGEVMVKTLLPCSLADRSTRRQA
jgi:hypothetical protein